MIKIKGKQKIDDNSKSKVLDFFSSLADKTRLEILMSIAKEPKNVNEIYEFIGKGKMTLSAISHQLKQLKNLNIVYCKKQGQKRLYELSDNFCWCILKDAFKQFNNNIEIKCKKCGK